ncbi:hypothetical protein [Thalassotalea piscium]|uniref:Flagellar biosynthesis protein FlgE n=1 Tax=Thalassotalea piscium TaxID=1230533 RepID=A0A7X0NG45_9GAMM|nr:hypothetical protein [Thalassotalea piscium]MBB6542846.1 hypothetical protein [Thalassotalea piscium]
MEIQSAFNSGIQGFQNAQEQATQAASNIAQAVNFNDQTANVNEQAGNEVAVNNAPQSTKANELPDLNQNIVDLKVAEYQAKASANVVKTADEALGTLLDVTA